MANVESVIRTNNFISAYALCNNIDQSEILRLISDYDTLSFVDRLFVSGYSDGQALILFDMFYNQEMIDFVLFNKEFSVTAFMMIRKCLEKGITTGCINSCGGSIFELVNLYINNLEESTYEFD